MPRPREETSARRARSSLYQYIYLAAIPPEIHILFYMPFLFLFYTIVTSPSEPRFPGNFASEEECIHVKHCSSIRVLPLRMPDSCLVSYIPGSHASNLKFSGNCCQIRRLWQPVLETQLTVPAFPSRSGNFPQLCKAFIANFLACLHE
jgi:hypothetical protein